MALLAEADEVAAGDPDLLSAIRGTQGLVASDGDRLDDAEASLVESVDLARSAGKRRQAAWSLSMLGRVHLLRGDLDHARAALDDSLTLTNDERWTSFRPWAAAFRSEAELLAGRDADAVMRDMQEAYALSCQIGDPCWEGATGRVVALTLQSQSRSDQALRWATEARRRAFRVGDRHYCWVCGSTLLTEAEIARSTGDGDQATAAIIALQRLAAATDMPYLLRRATALAQA